MSVHICKKNQLNNLISRKSLLLYSMVLKYIIHAVGPEYNKEKSTLFNSGQLYNTVYNTL